MSMTDPISDLLTQIRNALMAKHDRLDVPCSKLKRNLVALLKQEGFIQDFEVVPRAEDAAVPYDLLRIFLRYSNEGSPALRRIARISRPGRRVYRGAEQIRPVLNGLGTAIISTSKGLLTDRQAREQRVGGEVICEVW
jgi:small subunit ribosomal protein S8